MKLLSNGYKAEVILLTCGRGRIVIYNKRDDRFIDDIW